MGAHTRGAGAAGRRGERARARPSDQGLQVAVRPRAPARRAARHVPHGKCRMLLCMFACSRAFACGCGRFVPHAPHVPRPRKPCRRRALRLTHAHAACAPATRPRRAWPQTRSSARPSSSWCGARERGSGGSLEPRGPLYGMKTSPLYGDLRRVFRVFSDSTSPSPGRRCRSTPSLTVIDGHS
jgi:hypothetical protein